MESHGELFGNDIDIIPETEEKLVKVNRKDNPEDFDIEDPREEKIMIKSITEFIVSEDALIKVSPLNMYVMIHENDFFETFEEELEIPKEQKEEVPLPEEVGGKKVFYMDNLYPERDVPESFLRHLFF